MVLKLLRIDVELNDTKMLKYYDTGITSKCLVVNTGLSKLIQLYSFSLLLGHFYQNLFN